MPAPARTSPRRTIAPRHSPNGVGHGAANGAGNVATRSVRALSNGATRPTLGVGRDRAISEVVDCIRAIVRELRVSSRDAEQRLGIHGAQLYALQQLADGPAHSLAELAERTRTDSSSVSVVVSRLVERGLVKRTADADDRRRIVLALTASGRALVKRAPRSAHERIATAAQALSTRDLDALARGLSAIAGGLDGHGDD